MLLFLWLIGSWWLTTPGVAAQGPTDAAGHGQVHANTLRVQVEQPRTQYVLLLNSYSKGYAWTDNQVRGIKDVFADDRDVILRIEYMDTKMVNDAYYFGLLAEIFKYKYRQVHFDVIISTDEDALWFLYRYREQLFPGVPVVFAGVNNFNPAKLPNFSNYTGVNEASDFAANLKLIRRLHPRVKDVYVISDTLTSGLALHKEFDKAAAGFEGQLVFHDLVDIPMAELQHRLTALPRESVAFYLSFFRDATGASFTPWESLPQLSIASAVPVYGAADYMLGKGIIGGMLKSSYFQGEAAARLARRVLAGTTASTIPVVMVSPNHFMFDYRQLQRFGIPLGDLPNGHLLINEPETFYYKYQKVIWTTLGVFTLLVLYILVLLFNIQKRKRAQRGLQSILDSMSSLFDLQSLDRFREEIRAKLASVMPVENKLNRIAMFKYAVAGSETVGEGHLRSLDQPSAPSDDVIGISPQAHELIRESLATQHCVVAKKQGVALFKSQSLPSNLIYMEGTRNFDDMDRDLLEIFTNNVSMAIENLEKQKIEESLETARKIQLSMLPHYFERISRQYDIDLYARLIPAKEVGGDLYDFFSVDEQHIGFTVGDVSGKGVPAALFMAMAKTLVRAAAEASLDPAQVLTKVNIELGRDNGQGMFVTLFFAILNRATGELLYANGGHNPPYLVRRDGVVERLAVKSGIALGLFDEIPFATQRESLALGDALLIYSDGVTEAMDPAGAEFGEARLARYLADQGQRGAKQLTQELIEQVRMFAKEAPQSDDITVMHVCRNLLP